MNSPELRITGHAQHQAWQARIAPPVELVRPGLWSIPVPIPDSPLRYVLVYAMELPTGLAIVDAGWPTDTAWQALVSGLAGIGFGIEDVRAVLISHAHHDHHGLAGRVREASGAWIGMHPAEAATLQRDAVEAPPAAPWSEMMQAWSVRRGAPEAEVRQFDALRTQRPELPPLAQPDVLIEDGAFPLGESIGVQAIWTPGHTPGHLCFFDRSRDLMLTGDHVLPRISPNISLHARAEGDPLRQYLASLKAISHWEPSEVLPAHEYRFSGLWSRAHQLIEHHHHRFEEIQAAVEAMPGATTWAIAERLTWSRSWAETTGGLRWSAVGETLAHLVYLANEGCVVDKGGVLSPDSTAESGVDSWFSTDTPYDPAQHDVWAYAERAAGSPDGGLPNSGLPDAGLPDIGVPLVDGTAPLTMYDSPRSKGRPG